MAIAFKVSFQHTPQPLTPTVLEGFITACAWISTYKECLNTHKELTNTLALGFASAPPGGAISPWKIYLWRNIILTSLKLECFRRLCSRIQWVTESHTVHVSENKSTPFQIQYCTFFSFFKREKSMLCIFFITVNNPSQSQSDLMCFLRDLWLRPFHLCCPL